MTKKTGEQMLKELGYKHYGGEAKLFERIDIYSVNQVTVSILFNNSYKGYQKYIDKETKNCWVRESVCVNDAEHKAIHQCLLDFGWIKEDTAK